MSTTEKSQRGADRLLPYICFMTLLLFLHTIEFIHISPSGRAPEFTVNDASLTQFSYTKSNCTLSYNLALNISIRNPNKRSGLEYRGIQVIAYHQDKRFALVSLINSSTPFHQGRENTTVFHNVLVQGQKKLLLFEEADEPTSKFTSEAATGVYTIVVLLAFQEVKLINIGSGKVGCNLKLPLTTFNTYGTSAGGFNTTKCSRFYRDAADQRS